MSPQGSTNPGAHAFLLGTRTAWLNLGSAAGLGAVQVWGLTGCSVHLHREISTLGQGLGLEGRSVLAVPSQAWLLGHPTFTHPTAPTMRQAPCVALSAQGKQNRENNRMNSHIPTIVFH